MRNNGILLALPVAIFLLAAVAAAQQTDKSKRPSPPGTAEVTLKGKKITIEYSRPFMKGRKIMGDVVPYGKVWRTGANAATSLKTDVALNIGGTNVPAGSYTLYTLPGANQWMLIINKQTGQWGTKYDQGQDLARVPMKVTQSSSPMEQFTISLDKGGDDSATLKLAWENTVASVDVKEQK